ncbi:MAG: response regulator transcription factor [Alistipes sp.]|nr:response regulator transcription factor [Alistipes sp.]
MEPNNILILSPSRDIAAIIEGALADLGCNIFCCATPQQAIELSSTLRPCLVIILRASTLLCGSELISRLRPTPQRLPTIYVISWQQSEQTILSLLEMGVDQYMTFPICLSRLRAKASATLKKNSQYQ